MGVVAAGVLLALPARHTAEARLVVGSQSIQAQAVPGYANATQQLATTYSRFFSPSEVEDASVTVTPIPESAVIRVEATAGSETSAVRQAAETASTMVSSVNGNLASESAADDLLAQYEQAQADVLDATGGTVADEARLQGLRLRADAFGKAYQTQVQNAISGASTLAVVQTAVGTGSNTTSRWQIAILCAITFGVVVVFATAWITRAPRS
jgi:hypothetical protein